VGEIGLPTTTSAGWRWSGQAIPYKDAIVIGVGDGEDLAIRATEVDCGARWRSGSD